MNNNNKPVENEFFLPDLCSVQSVFLLVLISELMVLVMVLFSVADLNYLWQELAMTSLFVQWVVLLSASLLCGCRSWLSKLALVQAVALSYLIIMLVLLSLSLLSQYLLTMDSQGFSILSLVRNLLVGSIIAGIVLHYFYINMQWRLKARAELQFRLQALQSRIRPHFLFNSMNIIASLIMIDPEKAEQVVEDLSELFRASLNETGNQVLLDKELELCRRYVHIEQLRLDSRLRVEWNISPMPSDVMIPLLSLQPLLENAIYHGIQPLAKGGLVEIDISYKNGMVEVEMKNPLPPQDDRSHKGNAMALDNIRARLKALYGSSAKVKGCEGGQGYITRLSYPFKSTDKERADNGSA